MMREYNVIANSQSAQVMYTDRLHSYSYTQMYMDVVVNEHLQTVPMLL